jgi:hypothetical protein
MSGQVRVTFFAGLATLLTSLAFTPVFTVQTWFWPVLAALVLIGAPARCSGDDRRRRRWSSSPR